MRAGQFLWSSLEVSGAIPQQQETSKGGRASVVHAANGDQRLFSLREDVVCEHISILETVRDYQRCHALHVAQLRMCMLMVWLVTGSSPAVGES